MLEKGTAKLLSIITGVCGDGSYKIIEIADIIREMQPRFRPNPEELAGMMRNLADSEMIDIKYSDETVYCVAVLPKGRVSNEDDRIKRSARMPLIGSKSLIILILACFASGLLGAIVGAVLATLIK